MEGGAYAVSYHPQKLSKVSESVNWTTGVSRRVQLLLGLFFFDSFGESEKDRMGSYSIRNFPTLLAKQDIVTEQEDKR